MSLCITLGVASTGFSSMQTVTVVLSDEAGTVIGESGPCLVDRSFSDALALAVAVAASNAKGGSTAAPAAPASSAPTPVVHAAPVPAVADAAHQLLTQIAALPPEWQDYLQQTYAAQFGQSLTDDTIVLTQERLDFLASLLPQ
jgi:hypothetical protein